jgi:hypothetical protein
VSRVQRALATCRTGPIALAANGGREVTEGYRGGKEVTEGNRGGKEVSEENLGVFNR